MKSEIENGQPLSCFMEELIIYFNQRGQPERVAQRFYEHYRSCEWKTARGTPLSDWRRFARYSIKRERKK